MTRNVWPAALLMTAVMASSSPRPVAAAHPITVDDLMKPRSINDVRISPAGDRVAYVVSTPALPRNEHEPALFVVPVTGRAPLRLGESVRIFNLPSPHPLLRWSPDGSAVSVLAFEGSRPQVVSVPVSGGAAQTLTAATESVFACEWSPNGRSLAYITPTRMSPGEDRRG